MLYLRLLYLETYQTLFLYCLEACEIALINQVLYLFTIIMPFQVSSISSS